VGDRKLREFGSVFLGEIAAHLQTSPRQIFADDSFAEPAAPMPRRARLTDSVRETLHFFRQGKTVTEIARIRGVKDGTIYSHLEEAMLAGEAIDVKSLLTAGAQRDIAAAFAKHGFGSLGSVMASLGGKYSYGECRIVRAALPKRECSAAAPSSAWRSSDRV
jgi:ATP-dependent DNA helicase RecQ